MGSRTYRTIAGFSAIELLIVIGLLGLFASIVSVSFSGFQNSSVLMVETENMVSFLSKARTDTLSSKNDTVYGVHFEIDRAILFDGSSYVPLDPDNVTVELNPKVIVTNILLNGGGSDIVFKRLNGTTDAYGTISIALATATTTERTITIYATGLADID